MRSTLVLSFVFLAACTHHLTGPTGGADTNPAPKASDTGTSPTMPAGAKRAFVTSTQYSGKLSTAVPGGNVVGGAAGDALCQQAADAAELGGEWQAYLSDETSDANTRLEGNGPWYSTKGTKVFNNKANLATKPLVAFSLDERGESVEAASYNEPAVAWTGIGGGLCTNWTSVSDEYNRPTVGLIGAEDQSWRSATSQQISNATYSYNASWSCSYRAHLYCFEK